VVMDESSELKGNWFDSTSGETCIVFFSSSRVPRSGGVPSSILPVGKYWCCPFLPVAVRSVSLRNCLRKAVNFTVSNITAYTTYAQFCKFTGQIAFYLCRP
jgi:hypothetical protein